MNLFDSCFLCLDIGTSCVRGIAHRVRSGKITQSATAMHENFDQTRALNCVIENLETELHTHFDSAYITGNFGKSEFLRLFKEIDIDLWEKVEKNPVQFLRLVSQEKLDNIFEDQKDIGVNSELER